MKLNLIGGYDVQRSPNLADNQCINLYPTTNADGSIAAFYKVDGLSLQAGLSGIATGAYVTSNNRSFYVAGTTLYELSIVLGLLTSVSRGTVTAGTYDFSDNGIELIGVNGTDGWLLTLATNALVKIPVIQNTCTISNATPAVFTKTAHGMIAGTRFRLSTTGSLPAGLLTLTTYYVLAAGLTANAWEASLIDGGAAINTTSAGSGTHTFTTLGYGFPNGCFTVSYMNGRFIACEPDTQNFWLSEPLDGGWWDSLNVQTADSNPDNVVTQVVSHNELIVFCDKSGEAFYDSGTIPSPFVRNVSGIFEVGCAAKYSVAIIDNSIMWLGRSTQGQGIIYRLNGYTPTRISNFAIENAIQSMTDISDAYAFAYQKDGHHFYVITFPSGDKTSVFDINSNLWHERADYSDGTYHRWEGKHYFQGQHLITDRLEAKIYSIDSNSFSNGDEPIKVVRSFMAPPSDMKRICHHKLQIDLEVGVGNIGDVDPQLMLRWSDDGGHTWSAGRSQSMGPIGQYAKRVIFNRLGMTKGMPRIYEISCVENIKFVLLGAYLY